MRDGATWMLPLYHFFVRSADVSITCIIQHLVLYWLKQKQCSILPCLLSYRCVAPMPFAYNRLDVEEKKWVIICFIMNFILLLTFEILCACVFELHWTIPDYIFWTFAFQRFRILVDSTISQSHHIQWARCNEHVFFRQKLELLDIQSLSLLPYR